MRTPVRVTPLQMTSGTAGCVHKFTVAARTDTTAVNSIGLPAHLIPVHVTVQTLGAASDAGTTAVVQLIDASSSSVLGSVDVKSAKMGLAAVDVQPLLALGVKDTYLQVKYAETGTASTTGGPWLVSIECMAVG